MEYGIVYLLTNPVMPGLVKIGMTTREDKGGDKGRGTRVRFLSPSLTKGFL